MQPRFITSMQSSTPGLPSSSRSNLPYPLIRLPSTLPSLSSATASSLAIRESVPSLTSLPVNPRTNDATPSLYRGFKATIPSSELAKHRRRQIRGGLVDEEMGQMGLKKLGAKARGLLTDGDEAETSENVGRRRRRRKEGRRVSGSFAEGKMGIEDLAKQIDEIGQDKENLFVRSVRPACASRAKLREQSLLQAEVVDVSAKVDALEAVRRRLETSLLRLQEEQLELDDELEGLQEMMADPNLLAKGAKVVPSHATSPVKSSRRRRGPAFLPSEHDDLPSGVAFMVRPERV